MVTPRKLRFSRKNERGTAVVVVVMVTTLITAIGVFAVRNVSQIDQAVGYSRQSTQTNALAELGTTAAMAQITAQHPKYTDHMSDGLKCQANGPYAANTDVYCYKFDRSELEVTTLGNNGATLTEAAVAGTEAGSFGPLANTTGLVSIELTEKHPTNTPIPGGGSALDVTLTTTAVVSPITSDPDPCADGVPTMSVKKVMRAHVIVPSN
jgi:hypothetical protein